jgi:hypothetical protein
VRAVSRIVPWAWAQRGAGPRPVAPGRAI